MAYTEPQIRELIEKFTQADRKPELSQIEIDDLVLRSKRQDSSKRPPTDAAWEPTWNINAAVALGWELKAAMLATQFDIRSADQDFKRSQMYEMCLKQSNRWKARVTESPQMEGSLARDVPDGIFNNADDCCCCGLSTCSWCGRSLVMDGYTVDYW